MDRLSEPLTMVSKSCPSPNLLLNFFLSAQTMQLLLKGKTPALVAPALQNGWLKQDILWTVKNELFQHGTDIPGISFCTGFFFSTKFALLPGVADLLAKDVLKPIQERYVHSIITTEHGGILIFIFFSNLLALIHSALTIQVDTTFKQTAGDINKWEIVIWYCKLQRGMSHFAWLGFFDWYVPAVTIGRVYSSHSDCW